MYFIKIPSRQHKNQTNNIKCKELEPFVLYNITLLDPRLYEGYVGCL